MKKMSAFLPLFSNENSYVIDLTFSIYSAPRLEKIADLYFLLSKIQGAIHHPSLC
jgi:hypothetical protein